MREILFKAKLKLNGEWITGWYAQGFIGDINEHGQIIPETLCQYTGILDKNGNKIFEGDIIMFPDTESEYVHNGIGMQKVAEFQVPALAEVVFKDGAFGLNIEDSEVFDKGFNPLYEVISYMGTKNIEVTDNIYDIGLTLSVE